MIFGLSLVMVLLGGGSLWAQGADLSFGEVVNVEVVNVHVWVTDDRGNPVAALQREDFELRVDGEPVEITYFAELRSDRPVVPRGPAVRPEAPAGSPEEAVTQAILPSEEGSLVLYFDELHLSRLERKQVLRDLRELIAENRVAPEQVLILRQVDGLVAEAPFGSTRDQLLAALERVAEPPPGFAGADEKRLMVDRLWSLWEESRQRGRDPCRFFSRQAIAEIAGFSRAAANRSLRTMASLGDIAGFLGGVPGGKSLIYFGDALEVTPGADLLEIVNGLCALQQDQNPSTIASQELSTAFDRITDVANGGRVTIYTVQARGLRPGLVGSADQRGTDVRIGGAFSTFERALRGNERGGLEVLAAETGGEAILNRNRFDGPLDDIVRDLKTYYSLGFTPDEGFRRGDYDITVVTRNRGLNVRHRQGLRLKAPDDRLREMALGAIHLGYASNPMDLRLAHGAVEAKGGSRVSVPLKVLVPVQRIAYGSFGGDEPMASLRIVVHGRSPDQRDRPPLKRTFRFARPAGEGRAQLDLELDLEPGLHVLGVAVRDEVTGELSAVATTVGVVPPGAELDPGSGAR